MINPMFNFNRLHSEYLCMYVTGTEITQHKTSSQVDLQCIKICSLLKQRNCQCKKVKLLKSFSVQDLDESSPEEEEVEQEEVEISEELQAGDATPMSMPSAMDSDQTDSSPDETSSKPVVEVFDLPESSPDDISPDMESPALFVKLKEVCKYFIHCNTCRMFIIP